MDNQFKPAFPTDGRVSANQGLTKREYFAAVAMQGLLSIDDRDSIRSEKEIAELSVSQADALLEQLNSSTD